MANVPMPTTVAFKDAAVACATVRADWLDARVTGSEAAIRPCPSAIAAPPTCVRLTFWVPEGVMVAFTTSGVLTPDTSGATSLLTGGVYNSAIPTLTTGQQVARQVDTQGSLKVNAQGAKKTYRVSQPGLAPTAAGTLVQLQGSASKTITVTQIRFSGVLTAAASGRLRLFKNSATETGGTTATAGTVTPLDSAQPNASGASAVWSAYTTAGTPGALTGTLDSVQYFLGTSAAIGSPPLELTYGTRSAQGVVLRGTGEYLVLASTFGVYTGASWDISVEWTEE